MGGAPVQNLFLNALDLLVRQLRIHGKRENAGSRFFSDGQRMDPSRAPPGEPLLPVNRNWIVGECRDSLRGKMRLQLIPQITLNRIKMVNVLVTRWSERQSQRCSGETSVVYLCQFAASPAPLVNPFQLDPQDSRVDIIQTTVIADAVIGALQRAVVAQLANLRSKLLIVGHNRATVTKASQILLDDEA